MQRFAVIGMGRFGARLATNLAAAGQEVIGIDVNPAIIEDMRDRVTLAIALDATDEDALRMQGIDKVDAAVVGIGNNFEASALTTVTLKQLGVKRVISRAVSATAARILARIGADEVVSPEDESADRWATRLVTARFLNQLELGPGQSIVEINIPGTWVGKTLVQLRPRTELGVHVIAVKRNEGERGGVTVKRTLRLPDPQEPMQDDDVLVLMGPDEALARLPQAEK